MKNIIEEYPTLTTHGFGVDVGQENEFDIERANLLTKKKEFDVCCDWLKTKQVTTEPNVDIGTTYRLKQLVEKWYRETYRKGLYIPEGILITAALSLGIPFKSIDGLTSVYLGLLLDLNCPEIS